MTTAPHSLDPRTPVLIGVGQLDVPDDAADATDEPVDLMERALAPPPTLGRRRCSAAVDSVRVVAILSWRYNDPGRLLAERVGACDAHTAVSPMGGNSPQMLVNRSSLDIAAGTHDVVAITGAEAWRTRQAFRRRGDNPPWTEIDEATPRPR
jgi:acetyl-CoA C-acetyltransferase